MIIHSSILLVINWKEKTLDLFPPVFKMFEQIICHYLPPYKALDIFISKSLADISLLIIH